MADSALHATASPTSQFRRREQNEENLERQSCRSEFLRPRHRQHHCRRHATCFTFMLFVVLFVVSLISPVDAVEIEFNNCLSPSIINSDPVQLHFTPYILRARLDTTDPSHNLNISIYGNVSGSATVEPPPPSSDPRWLDVNETLGKIVNVSDSNHLFTTLSARFQVVTYTPYHLNIPFCSTLIGRGQCPLGPAFNVSRNDSSTLPGFSVAHQFYSSYSFTTISATFTVLSGDVSKAVLACVSANITPQLGVGLTRLLMFMPLVILILVGFATAFAAVLSPWGSVDAFKWTTNYGRDADLLRLVTPGFGDCLQYIQFAVLTGGLSLNYPGFYQPVVSQASWSTLMFNASFVSHGNGTQSLVDGIYVTHGPYGLDRLSQLVGLSSAKDIWAGMIIWLLVIIGSVIAGIQCAFFIRWAYRHLAQVQEEDLRAKNLPFTVGNVVRIVFNYFLLPAVALSMFQLVVTTMAPVAPGTTALAVVLLLTLIGFAVWLLRLIATIRPRSYLFDDLPTVLLYGPLYNTYSDNDAPFALIPLFIQLIRGIAIGAVQHSGIAQLVLLAICEVVLILTLHAFRPFHSTTSNNAYHTFFAIVRLLTVLLMVAFVPTLGVTEPPKGWIGYVILLMHAIVLVFGFFLNAIQTIIEVAARLAGAGGESGVGGGAARGGLVKVFGMRQLSRRVPRRHGRESGISHTDLLTPTGERKQHLETGRARSASGSSAVLLNRYETSDGRASTGLGSNSASGFNDRPQSESAYTPTTPGDQGSVFHSFGGGASAVVGGVAGIKAAETADPYYRPPRRRVTMENTPGAQSPGSWISADWANKRWSQNSGLNSNPAIERLDGSSISGRATPVPANLANREFSDSSVNEIHRSPTDYAVREVDFYYGVRGPALSNIPTRRLGTGPADPTGPVASAAGWFKGWFGGKTKEQGKGFEVIRSSRMPPHSTSAASPASPIRAKEELMGPGHPMEDIPTGEYGGEREVQVDEIGMALPLGTAALHRSEEQYSGEEDNIDIQDEDKFQSTRVSDVPPSLPGIDSVGPIEMPSRVGSQVSTRPSRNGSRSLPGVPRKSSRRSAGGALAPIGAKDSLQPLSTIFASPSTSPRLTSDALYESHRRPRPTSQTSFRFPFDGPSTGDASRTSTREGGSSVASMIGFSPNEKERNSEAIHARQPPSALGFLGADTRRDRPTSMGYVQQHRASDIIHHVTPGGQHDLQHPSGSSAELVDHPSRRSLDGSNDSRSARQ